MSLGRPVQYTGRGPRAKPPLLCLDHHLVFWVSRSLWARVVFSGRPRTLLCKCEEKALRAGSRAKVCFRPSLYLSYPIAASASPSCVSVTPRLSYDGRAPFLSGVLSTEDTPPLLEDDLDDEEEYTSSGSKTEHLWCEALVER